MNLFERIILLVFALMVGAVIVLFGWHFITYKAPPPQFRGNVVSIVESCIRQGTSSMMNNTIVMINEDRIMACLYDHEVTLVYRGDPVTRLSG